MAGTWCEEEAREESARYMGLFRPPQRFGSFCEYQGVGSNMLILCFVRFRWLHCWVGEKSLSRLSHYLISKRWWWRSLGWGGYGEKAWKGYHCLFSI